MDQRLQALQRKSRVIQASTLACSVLETQGILTEEAATQAVALACRRLKLNLSLDEQVEARGIALHNARALVHQTA